MCEGGGGRGTHVDVDDSVKDTDQPSTLELVPLATTAGSDRAHSHTRGAAQGEEGGG